MLLNMNELFKMISSLETEKINSDTASIDMASVGEILEMINNEDRKVPMAVAAELPNIERAVEIIVNAFKQGGRLFYFGAGTSGRLGIVDASECPPTFGIEPDMVQGIIAGGQEAVFKAQEGAEDKPESGANEIIQRDMKPPDVICGIAASGRTPFVAGALAEATNRGIRTIMISTVPKEKVIELGIYADIYICPDVGPEVIAGSTRMKSGTAQKLVLNMLTTASMIRLGKTYGNIMVDLQLTNHKLRERAKGIIMQITGMGYDDAEDLLRRAGGHVKTALVMQLANVTKDKAEELLEKSDGYIKRAIGEKV